MKVSVIKGVLQKAYRLCLQKTALTFCSGNTSARGFCLATGCFRIYCSTVHTTFVIPGNSARRKLILQRWKSAADATLSRLPGLTFPAVAVNGKSNAFKGYLPSIIFRAVTIISPAKMRRTMASGSAMAILEPR